jgi:hypothetical protein
MLNLRRVRGNLVRIVASVLIIPSATIVLNSVEPSPAAAVTPCEFAYDGWVTTNYANEGIYGDVNYQSGDMSITNATYDHAALYVDSNSQHDPHANNSAGQDWLQVGYFVGTADQTTTTTTQVYAESADQYGGPNLKLFSVSGFPLGNRWFSVTYTGESNGSYGYYIGTYSLSYDTLWTSWMIDPHYSLQAAQAEGYSDVDACPTFVDGLFGTNGNQSSPSWNSSTELEIDTNTSGDVLWTPSAIATSPHTYSPPYSIHNYSDDDAFNSTG